MNLSETFWDAALRAAVFLNRWFTWRIFSSFGFMILLENLDEFVGVWLSRTILTRVVWWLIELLIVFYGVLKISHS